jgi:hypothetical protein
MTGKKRHQSPFNEFEDNSDQLLNKRVHFVDALQTRGKSTGKLQFQKSKGGFKKDLDITQKMFNVSDML